MLDVAKNTSTLDFAENCESPTIGLGNPSPSSDLIGWYMTNSYRQSGRAFRGL